MITLNDSVREYLISCIANGRSDSTIAHYRACLGRFTDALGAEDVASITRSQIRHYLADMAAATERYVDASQKPTQAGGYSPATIESHKRALGAYWNWAEDEHDLDTNPMDGIKKRRRVGHHVRSISLATFRALLEQAEEQDRHLAARDRAILYLLGDTGIRASGLVELKMTELDMIQRRVIVTEKGLKKRVIPFTATTRYHIGRWMLWRPDQAQAVFCGFSVGREGQPLTVSGLNQIIKRLAKRAKIKETCSPHRIRHMFAREYLNRGGELATLSRLMGHEDMNITRDYYAVYTDEETSEKHERFSPVNTLDTDHEISE